MIVDSSIPLLAFQLICNKANYKYPKKFTVADQKVIANCDKFFKENGIKYSLGVNWLYYYLSWNYLTHNSLLIKDLYSIIHLNHFLKNYSQLNKPSFWWPSIEEFKKLDSAIVNDNYNQFYEDHIRNEFYNTDRGFYNCLVNYIEYQKNNQLCALCSFKKQCQKYFS